MAARHACAKAPKGIAIADSGGGWRIQFADGREWVREVFYCPFCGVELKETGLGRFPKKPPNTKRVRCVDTGEVFQSVAEAARSCGLNSSTVSAALNGRHPRAGGKRWEFA